MAVYLAGILAGIACGYTILTSSFGSDREARAASVRIWGLRGPLGCFMASWGAGAMLVAAPFDNWWHNAYGLDVKVLSLPHSLLSSGVAAIAFGALILVCSEANRATDVNRRSLDRLLLYTIGLQTVGIAVLILQKTWPGYMHYSGFYFAISAPFPLLLVMATQISRSKWPATTVAGFYMVSYLLFLWILPLFPAEPKLGPVYHPLTHFIPLGFPLLLVIPGFAIDLLRRRRAEKWGDWKSVPIAALGYFATILAAEWYFSYFLLSPGARNPIFGMGYFAFSDPGNVLYDPFFFYTPETTAVFLKGMLWALAAAIASSGSGMGIGYWLQRVKR